MAIPSDAVISAAAQIVTSYVASRSQETINLAELTAQVCRALSGEAVEAAAPSRTKNKAARPEPMKPAVSVVESVTPDYLVCLEDGKKVKMLKRYLMTNYKLTPEDYKKRWGLGKDYPMVAPNYAKKRSALAKKIGLGKIATRKGKTARAK